MWFRASTETSSSTRAPAPTRASCLMGTTQDGGHWSLGRPGPEPRPSAATPAAGRSRHRAGVSPRSPPGLGVCALGTRHVSEAVAVGEADSTGAARLAPSHDQPPPSPAVRDSFQTRGLGLRLSLSCPLCTNTWAQTRASSRGSEGSIRWGTAGPSDCGHLGAAPPEASVVSEHGVPSHSRSGALDSAPLTLGPQLSLARGHAVRSPPGSLASLRKPPVAVASCDSQRCLQLCPMSPSGQHAHG